MDKLIVKGLGTADGEYEFDLVAMLSEGSPDALTNRELHRLKSMSGVRAGELTDALQAGDNDVLVALAAIILSRKNRRVDEEKLWDAPVGAGLVFDIADREEADAEVPPAEPLPQSEATVLPVRSGGGSSRPASDPQATDPSPTGLPGLERSAISGRETLAS